MDSFDGPKLHLWIAVLPPGTKRQTAPQTQSSSVIHQLQIISAFIWDLIGGTERSLPSLLHVMPQPHPFWSHTANGSPAHWRDDSAPVLVRACEFGHLFTLLFIYPALHYCTVDELAREYLKYENTGYFPLLVLFFVLTIFQYQTEASVVQCQLKL